MERKACNIIATGNSLRGKDLTKLPNRETFGVNYAFKYVDCDYTVFYDNFLHAFSESKNPQYLECFGGQWKNTGGFLNFEEGCVGMANYSTLMAMQIAIQKGFNELHIYGFDNYLDEYIHFYDDKKPDSARQLHYLNQFRRMNRILAQVSEDFNKRADIYVYDSAISNFNNRYWKES